MNFLTKSGFSVLSITSVLPNYIRRREEKKQTDVCESIPLKPTAVLPNLHPLKHPRQQHEPRVLNKLRFDQQKSVSALLHSPQKQWGKHFKESNYSHRRPHDSCTVTSKQGAQNERTAAAGFHTSHRGWKTISCSLPLKRKWNPTSAGTGKTFVNVIETGPSDGLMCWWTTTIKKVRHLSLLHTNCIQNE